MSVPKRILIVRLGAMGDILHAMPAVAALQKAFPGSNFGWMVEERWADLLRSSSEAAVNKIHTVDTRRWRKALLARETRAQISAALREVRDRNYDAAIDFQGAVKSALLAKLSRAPRIFGYATPWEQVAAMLYSDKAKVSARHVVDQAFQLADAFSTTEGGGAVDTHSAACVPTDVDAQARVEEILMAKGVGGRFAILNPGAGWGAKQWPSDRYAEIARAWGEAGVRSLVNFGPGEEAMAKAVEDKADGYAISAQFAISELIAVTRRASLFVGGDTGPLHLAAALGVPVVALFGPTDPARTGPYGTRSIVLRDPSSVTSHKRVHETEAGLMNITTEQVIAASRQLLFEGKQ